MSNNNNERNNKRWGWIGEIIELLIEFAGLIFGGITKIFRIFD